MQTILRYLSFALMLSCHLLNAQEERKRFRDFDLKIGILPSGNLNAITDVPGVQVGHQQVIRGEDIRTGVTVIKAHEGNLFQEKVPAAVFVANGFGKMAGISQVNELGNLESPIALTNTLAVGTGIEALVAYTLAEKGNEQVRSVNAVVGETNDGFLNDIRSMPLSQKDFLEALSNAQGGPVPEGNVGAGTGTVCFGLKGGIGTSSRKVPQGYTVGVLVQSNFGGVLEVSGKKVGEHIKQHYLWKELQDKSDGSCMIVVATDAPLDHRQLMRLAKRAMLGLGKTGGIASHGSGDYVISFSTRKLPKKTTEQTLLTHKLLPDEDLSPLFLACIEATEEAIMNSLFMAQDLQGHRGSIEALPIRKILPLLKD